MNLEEAIDIRWLVHRLVARQPLQKMAPASAQQPLISELASVHVPLDPCLQHPSDKGADHLLVAAKRLLVAIGSDERVIACTAGEAAAAGRVAARRPSGEHEGRRAAAFDDNRGCGAPSTQLQSELIEVAPACTDNKVRLGSVPVSHL